MKKIFTLAALFIITLHVSAQTKKIAHRSHSGKDHTLILTTEDNFGGPAVPPKKDTVVVKKDTVKVKHVIYKKKKKKKITHIK